MFIFMKGPHCSQVATMYFMYHEYKQPRRCQILLRPQWSGARLWPHDGERCLCKSENKFSPWLVWAMVQWGFVVPAKVIRESNCILYCPRMSGPNWAWVPHPSTHDSVYMSVYESVWFFCMFFVCVLGVCRLNSLFAPIQSDHTFLNTFTLLQSCLCTVCMYCMCMFAWAIVFVCLQAGIDRAWEKVRQHH